jgi:hypothetical protein
MNAPTTSKESPSADTQRICLMPWLRHRLLRAASRLGLLAIAFNSNTNAAIIFSENEQASSATGQSMALADKVRQVQFNITGGSISRVDGTATPLGPWYSGISKHYFDYVQNASGSPNFTILIATGASWGSRLQEISIVNVIEHPTLDFVLLQHAAPVVGASLPQFAAIARLEVATFAGFGIRQLFGETTTVHDGNPAAFTMRVINVSSQTNFIISSNNAPSLPGGGLNFDSSSPGYNSSGQLCLFLDSGTSNSSVGTAGGGAIPFIASGLATFIEQNTPLNTPSSPTLACTINTTAAQLTLSNLTPSREYRVMRSSTLCAWAEAHRFTATAPTDSWSEARAPGGIMFYRLEWNE